MGVDGLTFGFGYGEAQAGSQANAAGVGGDDTHITGFANYAYGPVTFGYQMSEIQRAANAANGEVVDAWGLAYNVNDDLSISYGERTVTYDAPSGTDVDEEGEGIAIAYTMGSMTLAGTLNKIKNEGAASTGAGNTKKDSSDTFELNLSFAF